MVMTLMDAVRVADDGAGAVAVPAPKLAPAARLASKIPSPTQDCSLRTLFGSFPKKWMHQDGCAARWLARQAPGVVPVARLKAVVK